MYVHADVHGRVGVEHLGHLTRYEGVPIAYGGTEQTNSCKGKHRDFFYAQVVNSLILRIKDSKISATKVSDYFFSNYVLSAK